jgi:hypothetical protein
MQSNFIQMRAYDKTMDKTKLICKIRMCVAARPPLWSSGQSSWVRLPALPDFLRSSGSGTGLHTPGGTRTPDLKPLVCKVQLQILQPLALYVCMCVCVCAPTLSLSLFLSTHTNT